MKTASCLLVWLTLLPLVREQVPRPTTEQLPAIAASGAFFALSVADIEASAKWYSEKLGLKVVMKAPKRDHAAVTVLEGGGLIVELIQRDDAAPLGKAAPSVKVTLYVHGMFKAGVIVDDFEKTLAMLKARGVDFFIGPFPGRANQR